MSISMHAVAQSAIALVTAITLTDALREGINYLKPSTQLIGAIYRVMAIIFIIFVVIFVINQFGWDAPTISDPSHASLQPTVPTRAS